MRDKGTFTRAAYLRAAAVHTTEGESVTASAERQAIATGRLDPLVDPAGFGVIRRSLPRLEQLPNKLWQLAVGVPMPIETRVDTTGSMGDNVDIAFRVLPNMFEHCAKVLPGYDLQVATGIFGDQYDRFILCRPQFEMEAEKIVPQLTLMVPERQGGDATEDPQYGLFGAAYLTDRHINKLGLKGYDFTASDEQGRTMIDGRQLRRVFGDEVLERAKENGFSISNKDMPTTKEVGQDLLKCAHAFFLQVGGIAETTRFWANVFGNDRVVMLPSTEVMPQVQAVIIGLTEGTLQLADVEEFLRSANVAKEQAQRIVRSVAKIPIGAQAALPNFGKRPKKGDLFREKTDPWPIDASEVPTGKPEVSKGTEWL